MKTSALFVLLLLATSLGYSQINNNSTQSNSNGDILLRRYNSGDTAWKRALVVGYNPANSNGKLYINYGGDFKDGLRIDGSHVSVSGKLGVNSNNPIGKLDVRMDKNWSNAAIVIPNTNDADPKFIFYRPTGYKQTSYPWYMQVGGFNTASALHFATGSYANIGAEKVSSKLTLQSNGNVGIGTTSPKEKLSVNGNIRAKEVKVELANWPDYVFEADYDLPKLSTVKAFIQQNGHLPDIPAATEVHDQGLALGNISAKLLQKIEELTLYTLQQEDQLQQQQQLIEVLSTRLSQIESQLTDHESPTP